LYNHGQERVESQTKSMGFFTCCKQAHALKEESSETLSKCSKG
jgi:hypothetical protein